METFPRASYYSITGGRWSVLKQFDKFHVDVEKGELATYSFIEPRYINFS